MTQSIYDFGGRDLPEVNVDQSDWATLEGRGVIFTEGIGSGIGISVYDYHKRKAFLAHLPANSRQTDIVDAIKDNFSRPQRLSAWLGGAQAFVPNAESRVTDTTRFDILEALRDFGIPNVRIRTRWLEAGEDESAISYARNAGTGEELIIIEEDLGYGQIYYNDFDDYDHEQY